MLGGLEDLQGCLALGREPSLPVSPTSPLTQLASLQRPPKLVPVSDVIGIPRWADILGMSGKGQSPGSTPITSATAPFPRNPSLLCAQPRIVRIQASANQLIAFPSQQRLVPEKAGDPRFSPHPAAPRVHPALSEISVCKTALSGVRRGISVLHPPSGQTCSRMGPASHQG